MQKSKDRQGACLIDGPSLHQLLIAQLTVTQIYFFSYNFINDPFCSKILRADFLCSLVLYLYTMPPQSARTSTAIDKSRLTLCTRSIILENKDGRCDYYLNNALKIFHYFKYLGLFLNRIMLCYVCAVYGD